MVLKFAYFAICLGFFSCGTVKNNSSEKEFTIQLKGTVHKPYCGGARPTPEVAAGYYESMSNQEFVVYNGTAYSEKMTEVKRFQFDVEGATNLKLKAGNYMLFSADKTKSTNDFMKINTPTDINNYQMAKSDCFIEWQHTPDLIFTVKNDSVIEMRAQARCYTGTNPCLKYTGPQAP